MPITYFFIPPPDMADATLADSGRPVTELYRSLLGTDDQPDESTSGSATIGVDSPGAASDVLTALFGADGAEGNWHDHYRTWRAERIAEVEKDLGSGLDGVAEFLADFAARIKALGPSGYLRSLSGAEDERTPIDDKE